MLSNLSFLQCLTQNLLELPRSTKELRALVGVEIFGCGEVGTDWNGWKEIGESAD